MTLGDATSLRLALLLATCAPAASCGGKAVIDGGRGSGSGGSVGSGSPGAGTTGAGQPNGSSGVGVGTSGVGTSAGTGTGMTSGSGAPCAGIQCGPGQVCSGNTCVCEPGLSPCAGGCFDLGKDAKHCGGCKTFCGSGEFCQGGMCQGGD